MHVCRMILCVTAELQCICVNLSAVADRTCVNSTTWTHEIKSLDLMNVPLHRRQYECHICRYSTEGFHYYTLRKHLNEVHPVDIKCDVCGKEFNGMYHFQIHKLIHGERLLQCQYCPKKFCTALSVKRHEDVHIKPVKCDKCDYRCASKKILKFHKEKVCKNA